jgi:hypothetical protein
MDGLLEDGLYAVIAFAIASRAGAIPKEILSKTGDRFSQPSKYAMTTLLSASMSSSSRRARVCAAAWQAGKRIPANLMIMAGMDRTDMAGTVSMLILDADCRLATAQSR